MRILVYKKHEKFEKEDLDKTPSYDFLSLKPEVVFCIGMRCIFLKFEGR